MTGWIDEGASQWGGRPIARSVAEAKPRCRAVLTGSVRAVRHPAAPPRWVDALLDDGTGTIALRWVGREEVPGIAGGRWVTVEGTVLVHHGHLLLLNPLYRFSGCSSSTSW